MATQSTSTKTRSDRCREWKCGCFKEYGSLVFCCRAETEVKQLGYKVREDFDAGERPPECIYSLEHFFHEEGQAAAELD